MWVATNSGADSDERLQKPLAVRSVVAVSGGPDKVGFIGESSHGAGYSPFLNNGQYSPSFSMTDDGIPYMSWHFQIPHRNFRGMNITYQDGHAANISWSTEFEKYYTFKTSFFK